jgi:hypothetical protein
VRRKSDFKEKHTDADEEASCFSLRDPHREQGLVVNYFQREPSEYAVGEKTKEG